METEVSISDKSEFILRMRQVGAFEGSIRSLAAYTGVYERLGIKFCLGKKWSLAIA